MEGLGMKAADTVMVADAGKIAEEMDERWVKGDAPWKVWG